MIIGEKFATYNINDVNSQIIKRKLNHYLSEKSFALVFDHNIRAGKKDSFALNTWKGIFSEKISESIDINFIKK